MAVMGGRFEVQGIVSAKTGEPMVQFRQLQDNRDPIEFQAPVLEAREMAQQIVEAAMNAVYDAAIVSWIQESFPSDWEQRAAAMLTMIRQHRADTWGLPDQPEDWRP